MFDYFIYRKGGHYKIYGSGQIKGKYGTQKIHNFINIIVLKTWVSERNLEIWGNS